MAKRKNLKKTGRGDHPVQEGSERREGRNFALFRLSADLEAVIYEEEVYRSVAEGLHDTLGYDFVAVFRHDPKTGNRDLMASAGFVEPVTPLVPGEGLSERPLLTGKLHYSHDVKQEPGYFYGADGSEVDVPIWGKDRVIGVLTCESKRVDAFNDQDFDVLTAAAQIAGLAIEKARLFAQLNRRAAEFEALSTTMAAITSEKELPELLNQIVAQAADLMNSSGGELALFDEEVQALRLVVSHNLEGNHVGAIQKMGEGLMGKVAETLKPMVIQDYSKWHGQLPGYEEIKSVVGVPLVVGKNLLGVFTVTRDSLRAFDSDDLYLLNLFSQQAAIAIQNTSLLNQAQREIQRRIEIQREITRQKEYYEALLVNNPVAVVTADLRGMVVSWNPSAEKLFGYSNLEAIGENLDDLVTKDGSQRREAKLYSQEVFEKGHVHTSTLRTRKDGSAVEVELLALPVIVSGEMVGYIAIYHDLTDIKAIETRLRTQNQRMARELELAGEIQISYLPRRVPDIPGWQFHCLLRPSHETSGDFYDLRMLPDGRIAILIADVVDKGVGAALFMSLCWTLIRTFAAEFPFDPDLVLDHINQRILEDTKSRQSLTCFYGILDPDTGEIIFSNAGHPPVYIFSSRRENPVSLLHHTGTFLGVFDDRIWEKERYVISPGEGLFLYTDGITEGFNAHEAFYGAERLKNVVRKFSEDSAERICSEVLRDLDRFVGTEPQSDDIAMIVVKRESLPVQHGSI